MTVSADERAELVRRHLLPPKPLPPHTCERCGLTSDGSDEWGGPDPCIGYLPGVTSACCGHGRTALPAWYPYLWLEGGGKLSGPFAIERMRELGGNPLGTEKP